MSDLETRFHETWLGMVQPTDGLVVSVPVLVAAQCMRRLDAAFQQRFSTLCEAGAVKDLAELFTEVLELPADLWDTGDAIHPDLLHDVVEGHQTIRPTHALRRDAPPPATAQDDGRTPAARAAERYLLLVWDIPPGLDLDKPETTTGPWHYPPAAKFDRLLRHCRSAIGLITNRRELRLVYAPHGESSGSITFRVKDMLAVDGRPILEAFVMLLGAPRWFTGTEASSLPTLLSESRLRQANVTNALAKQVFEALQILLTGFEGAAERDGHDLLRDALERDDDHLYGGLLTVLLRLVFLLYAEDRGLMPVDDDFYSENLSVLELYEQLQRDQGLYPDSMSRRHGAWPRLVAVFRAVFLGVKHGDLHLPPRHGELFDPHRFPFLEGWGPGGSAPITLHSDRAAVRVPSVDDGTIYEVLHRLLFLEGQRLSYRTLDVEQIGSVYEALMGYHVVRVDAPAVCLRPSRVWVTAREVLAEKRREAWLQDEAGLPKSQAKKLADALEAAKDDEEAALAALETCRESGTTRAAAGRLVLQPGSERRRTSSHYTPRSLSEPIVRRTLEPLLAAMTPMPTAKGILELKVCDPAMGSGAFLVEACRFLADRLVEAWTREGQLERIAAHHPDVVHHARRLIAQRCLYGVDRNPFAVNLAKLSLWLATLAKDLPFTFLDHALRCGDSLVGLSFDQVCAFNWAPQPPNKKADPQYELFGQELQQALSEAIELRQRICDLASDESPQAQDEKKRLLGDAADAMDRVLLAADVCVGAFFAHDKDKTRESERARRQVDVERWLRTGEPTPPELLALQGELRQRVRPFHWHLEFPEVFYLERPDPLEGGRVNREAWFDAFVGNPPFAGKNQITDANGATYLEWLLATHNGTHGNADYSAHFFRRTADLLGRHGTIGLIATKTIGQGDTRTSGLQPLLGNNGFVIYEAVRSMPWPGEAAVSVAIVHLARGSPVSTQPNPRLDGNLVKTINSQLRPQSERRDAKRLVANEDAWFQGAKVMGDGFFLTEAERADLVARNSQNAERIFPYIGGQELNSHPEQMFHRYVINFGKASAEEAEQYPDLFNLVKSRVREDRELVEEDRGDGAHRKSYWWQFARPRQGLFDAISDLDRCLAISVVTKHLCFSFQPVDRVFSHAVNVFPLESYTAFGILQSRVHEAWARLLSSSMRTDLRYAASDCFETFPFPHTDPRATIPPVEAIGQRLYDVRAAFMREAKRGLTQTYNLLKDRAVQEEAARSLRELHEELDRVVLECYGWSDIAVPPFAIAPGDDDSLEAFQDEVIDRLFDLNATRADEENRQGLKPKGKKDGQSAARKAVSEASAETRGAPPQPRVAKKRAATGTKKKAPKKSKPQQTKFIEGVE